MDLMTNEPIFNRVILHPDFNRTIEELNKINITLPRALSPVDFDFRMHPFPPNGELVTNVEEIKPYQLDVKNGIDFFNSNYRFSAYDESINKVDTIEGSAFATCHSFISLTTKDYLPACQLTLYYYTRALEITKRFFKIKYSDNPDSSSKKDYYHDKIDFLKECTPSNTILFIDGPLVGGDYHEMIMDLYIELFKKNIIPVFFVKNSDSNLVVDHIRSIKDRFNSDLHWAYMFLKPGQRTNLFRYQDKHNAKIAKLFCYLKAFDNSPQRIEFFSRTLDEFPTIIDSILDSIYYLMLVQGDISNPQIRPIAIAEKFARETIKLINFNKIMKDTHLIPTMNQERFAW